jgi:hypothetical protein
MKILNTFNKTHETIFFCLLFFVIMTPSVCSDSVDKKFDLKISGGLTYLEVGDWNAHHVGWNEQRRMSVEAAGGTVISENQELHWGWEIAGEFIWNLDPRYAISAGIGYIHGNVTDSAETMVDSLTASNIHDFTVKAIPLRIGGYYFFPIAPKLRLSLNAGLGYYFAKFDRFYRREPGDGYWINSEMTGTSGGIGFDGGIGFEYSISKNVTILIEGYGRYAKITGFEGNRERNDSNNWSDSIDGNYYALERDRQPWGWFPVVNIATTAPTGEGTRNVRDATLDYSGFTIRLGLKIKLF